MVRYDDDDDDDNAGQAKINVQCTCRCCIAIEFSCWTPHQDIVPGSETVLQGKYTMCGWERCFELSLNGS